MTHVHSEIVKHPELVQRLIAVAEKADFGIAPRLKHVGSRLQVRVAEVLTYHPPAAPLKDDDDDVAIDGLGWHDDFGSHIRCQPRRS